MKLTVKGFKKVNNADTNTVEDKSIINKELDVPPIVGSLFSLIAIFIFCIIKVAKFFGLFKDAKISKNLANEI